MDLRTTARSSELIARPPRCRSVAAALAMLLSTAVMPVHDVWAGKRTPPQDTTVDRADAETEFVRRRNEQIKFLPAVTSPPQVSGPTFNPIDAFIVAAWQKTDAAAKVPTPEVCDDATFARRVYLDLIGVVPTVIELNQFLVDSSEGKRRKLVDHLLSQPGRLRRPLDPVLGRCSWPAKPCWLKGAFPPGATIGIGFCKASSATDPSM